MIQKTIPQSEMFNLFFLKPKRNKWFLLLFIFLLTIINVHGQTNGDYRTRYTGSTVRDWNTASNWQRYTGFSWQTASSVPSSDNNVTIRDGARYSISSSATCASLTIASGGTLTYLAIANSNSLTVTNGITINASTADNIVKYISVGAGSISCASVTMVASTNDTSDSYISVS